MAATEARLIEQIALASDMTELRQLREQFHLQAEHSLSTLSLVQRYTIINETHDAFIRKTITLAEAELARHGRGSPPVPYAYLLFGSGGRHEQTLSSDQDSGIIYTEPEETLEAMADQYFQQLGQTVVKLLQELGYPPCDGNVISSEGRWCKSISGWQKQLDEWIEEADWESVRYLLIVADGRTVFGQQMLHEQLMGYFATQLKLKPQLLRRMLDNTLRHKVLLGIFGQLLKEQYGEEAGSIDIKYGAYIPMVNAIRLLALQAGITATATLERISQLKAAGKLGKEEAEGYESAFELFLALRMQTLTSNEKGLYSNNGKVRAQALTKEMKDKVKKGLRAGDKLQKLVRKQTLQK